MKGFNGTKLMTIGIMQPYLFPYIGYFQLVHSVDKFIFYDDVNFIKNGWINRNRLMINGEPRYFTIQLRNASSFTPINEVHFTDNRKKIIKTIEQNYKKAPFFNDAWPFILKCLERRTESISELAIASVIDTCEYLCLQRQFEISSKDYIATRGLERAERIKEICRLNGTQRYNNPIGGTGLYSKTDFENSGIELSFIKTLELTYPQGCQSFVQSLSIIDVIMFNSVKATQKLLSNYILE